MNTTKVAPSDACRGQILAAARTIGVLGGGAGSAPRIMAALCDPAVDAKQVTMLLRDQPALCARVLKVANSALYGQTKSVKSLDRALIVLGLDAVRGIAAAACLNRAVSGAKSMATDLETVVSHSLTTAAAADCLAKHRFPDLAADAFIAGLLHNLGAVVQMYIDPAGIRALLSARLAGDSRDLAVLEAELTAVGHEECGAVLFEEWQMPQPLIAAARHHHNPLHAPKPDRRLTALIHVGSALAVASGSRMALEPADAPPSSEALEYLGLDEAQLAEAAAAIAGRFAEMKRALHGR